jgi:hypothetical protein
MGDDETVIPDDADELRKLARLDSESKSETGESLLREYSEWVTWTAPVGERFIRWKEDEEER